MPPTSEATGALVESNKATYFRRKIKRVLSEDLLNWQTCRGHSESPLYLYIMVH